MPKRYATPRRPTQRAIIIKKPAQRSPNLFKWAIRLVALGGVMVLFAAACNASSDASSIIQSKNTEYLATISYFESLQTPNAQQIADLQKQIDAKSTEVAFISQQNRDLTARLNAEISKNQNSPVANTQPVNPGTGAVENPVNPGAVSAVITPLTSPGGLTIQRIVLARAKDSNGCAVEQVNEFNAADEFIYVIATVTNFKRDTAFVTTWAGGDLNQKFDWTSTYDAAEECIHFFINPAELSLGAGTYTVTFQAGDLIAPALQFVVQAPQ